MSDSNFKRGDVADEAGSSHSGIRLSKEQRKQLLAEIEQQLSRTETPRRILQRAEQALADGNLDQARRLLQHLESTAPETVGLDIVLARVGKAVDAEKREANVRQAEEMLRRYLQQRKKPLAELALQTLVEIAPNHRRRQEYESWVADLDQELAMQQRVDQELAAGRSALRDGDAARAQRHLAALRRIDPTAAAIDDLAAELVAAEQVEAESADILLLKQTVEELIRDDRFDDAGREIERLSRLDVPKLTIDFLRKRLDEARFLASEQAAAEALTVIFQRHLESQDWQSARDAAYRFGERFPDRPEAAELFNRVTELEDTERRRQSLRQGVSTLEKLIAEGQRQEAEVALKLLRRLELSEQRLALFEQRVAAL